MSKGGTDPGVSRAMVYFYAVVSGCMVLAFVGGLALGLAAIDREFKAAEAQRAIRDAPYSVVALCGEAYIYRDRRNGALAIWNGDGYVDLPASETIHDACASPVPPRQANSGGNFLLGMVAGGMLGRR